jgi:Skp family chaperone for outer membrane proteins
MDIQTIGRAARMCSHSQFANMKEWNVKVHRYFSEYPTNMSEIGDVDPENIKEKIEIVDGKLKENDKKLEEIKGQRGTEIKKTREDIKLEIQTIKKHMKELRDKYKIAKDLNLSELKMVDELIYKESNERQADISIMYDVMRKSSIH